MVISYNVLNLPGGVVTTASGSLTYTYLSDGTKVSAIKSDGSGERYIGSFVYSVPASGSETLESAAWDEGRINFTKSGSTYTKTDLWHVGNVRTVVNVTLGLSAPQVLERNDFLPFGTRINAGTAVLTSNRFRLGGKENQTFGSLDLGKVDFGARMYDPFTAGWTTADPLAAKYGSMSPYNYCSENPTNITDPRGNDIWEINNRGEIINKLDDKTQDAFFLVRKNAEGNYQRIKTNDANGNLVDTGITFKAGTVTAVRRPKVNIKNNDIEKQPITMFEIKGDDKASQLFEFLANPSGTTNVEWTHAKIGTKKSNRNIVGTSHDESSTAVGQYLRLNNYTLREVNHNHPSGIGKPSEGDKQGAAFYHQKNPNTLLNIYTHPNQYNQYDQNGLITP